MKMHTNLFWFKILSSILIINTLSNETSHPVTPRITKINTSYTNSSSIMQIDQTKNNSLITVPRNTTFELHVEANPTTGYMVYLKNYNSIDKTYLRFENLVYDEVTNLYRSDEYLPNNNLNNQQNLVGTGGVYIFRITTLRDFNSIFISFVKIQPWDLNSETAQINLKLTTSTLPYTNSPLLNKNANATYNSGNNISSNFIAFFISLALLFI